jgi:hypothetical protein
LQVYNDNQNIHNHYIQESIFNSVVNIINQNYIYNIIHDFILNDNTKKLLLKYCNNKDIHYKTQLTFKDLLCNEYLSIH